MRIKFQTRRVVAVVLLVAFMLGVSGAKSIAAQPVKLNVRTEAKGVRVGEGVEVTCTLLDANNQPAETAKDVSVEVESQLPSGKTTTRSVVLKAGQSAYQLALPATEAGITEIRAKQKELIGGGTFIKVKPPRASQRSSASGSPAVSAPVETAPRSVAVFRERLVSGGPQPKSAPAVTTPGSSVTTTSRPMSVEQPAMVVTMGDGRSMETNETTMTSALSLPSPPTATAGLGLILKLEHRNCLADGQDAVTVFAFLDGSVDVAPEEIQVTLFNDKGHLIPLPLSIQKGEDMGQARLTCDEVGTITIEYVKSRPPVALRTEKAMTIRFGPPITKLEVQASPPSISLLETTRLILNLKDKNAKLVATDEPRQVNLVIQSGDGAFASNVVTVANGAAFSDTVFMPRRRGQVVISASTPNLGESEITIMVLVPVLLLICSGVGGLLGGVVASSVNAERRSHKLGWAVRLAIGLITGFTLYYFVLLGLLSKISGGVALNPIGAVFLSTVGGYMGSEVFTPIVKWLGIGN